MPIMLTIGDYRVKVIKHNINNCFVGKFVGTSKFPTIYGDNVREVEEIATEYVMEENKK